MKNKHIFIPLFVFLGAGVVSLIWSIIDFKGVNKQLSYASETIQFNFDGASDGTDPNGDAFDAVNFMTDDVIEKALAASSLTGEKYEVEKVKQYIAIENVVPKNIVQEIDSYESVTNNSTKSNITSSDYHPVRFRFVVYQDLGGGLSKNTLEGFVKNLVKEYRAKFDATYSKVLDKEAYDELVAFDTFDYTYQTKILMNKVNVIVNYANDLFNKRNSFVSPSLNKNFDQISSDGLDILGVIDNADKIISYRAISKDPETLKDYFDYEIKVLEYEQVKYNTDLQNVKDQIDNYHKDDTTYIGSGETVITVTTNSGETYDALLARKIEIENKLADIGTQITNYQDLKVRVDAVTANDRQNIETRISDIKKKYTVLETEFSKMLEEYNEEYMGENVVTYSDVTYQSSSLFSSAFISRAIKIAAPIMLSTMLGIAIYYLVREARKPQKQKKAA